MSRNNTVIQNKLLDAFDPIISFKNSASPFQFKEAVRNDIGFAPRTSISRNSYIEVEEKLEEDKTDNLRVGFEANLNFQPNNRKKYLKVMSNSQELRSTSNRKGVQNNKNKNIMKGSCIFQHQKIEKVTWPNEVISAKIVNHHQSCHNLSKQFNFPIRTAPSPPIIRPKSPSFQSQHEQSFAQKSAILKQTEKEGSIQLSEQSKIRILEQLSTDDHILKPKLDKNQYINYTESTSKQLLSRNSSNNSIKIERTENFSSKPQLQIRPRPNFVCVALNNGQPVFQTIVKKDLRILPSNKNLQIQPDICQRSPFILSNQPNFHQLIQPNPMKQIVLGEQKQKMCGRVNNLMFTETSNIRNKIAFQVLR